MKDAVKTYFNINLEPKEHSLKGWNWGKAEFAKHELHFNVANRPAFEIPYSEVTNLNLAGKAEVAVEFASGETAPKDKKSKKKATAGVDQLVEMRFYVPGTQKKEVDGEDGASENGDEAAKEHEVAAANHFYDTLKEKADIGEVAGVTIATFLDILFLTPRFVFRTGSIALSAKYANGRFCTEVVTISICTSLHSVCVVKHTTTRSSTIMSRNIFSFPSPTTYI